MIGFFTSIIMAQSDANIKYIFTERTIDFCGGIWYMKKQERSF